MDMYLATSQLPHKQGTPNGLAVHVPCLRVVLPGVPGCVGPCAHTHTRMCAAGARTAQLRVLMMGTIHLLI